MKFKFLMGALICLSLASCIKEEGVDREADILEFTLPEKIMSNIAIDNDNDIITIIVHEMDSVVDRMLAPEIKVSEGATIFPMSGDSVLVTNNTLTYIVTAESGQKKEYIVFFTPYVPLKFDFEQWSTVGIGIKQYDKLDDPFWANANAGGTFVGTIVTGNYPTQKTTDAYAGKYAAYMETKLGLKGGSSTVPAILPGSLFRGKFALTFPREKSAKFGQTYAAYLGKPTKMTGYYKYKPGPEFCDSKSNPVLGRIDECDIYAVLFKVKRNGGLDEFLLASDIKTSEKVVATAYLENWLNGESSAREEYTYFEIPFTHKEKLDFKKNDYKLAIVFTSSKNGDEFYGAIGSALYVDEVEIVSEPIKKK